MPIVDAETIEAEVKYHIDYSCEIGRGRNTVVRNCIDVNTGEQYAVKSTPLYETEIVREMKKEADLLHQIDHPNVVKVYDTFEDKECFHMVTEMCKGGELYDRVIAKANSKKKRYSEREAAKIIRQIVEAIACCHEKQIVHRDLKLENIMMKEEKKNSTNVSIIDFGLSTKHDGAVPMKTRVGSIYYVAPEVLEQNYNSKCDVWSIGVIAYVLLSGGKPPFMGANESETFDSIRSRNIQVEFPSPRWDGISDTAKRFVSSLLQKEPSLRPSIEDLTKHEWLQEDPRLEFDGVPSKQKLSSAVRKFKKVLQIKSRGKVHCAKR